MLSWSQTQKLKMGGMAGFLLVLAAVLFWVFSSEQPDCANGVRDGDERGVDCGGSCRFVCREDALQPLIHFVRAVPVSESMWGAVAYLENRNEDAGARGAPYIFKLYDENNLLLFERHGEAYIPPRKAFALFEGRMYSGSRTPTRATFAFVAPPRFERMPAETVLLIRNKRFQRTAEGSRLTAELSNPTLASFENVLTTALLFDKQGNIFAASAANIPRLPPGGATPLSFTWPQAFAEPPARVEILYVMPGR